MSEKELISAMKNGSEKAFEEIYLLYNNYLHRILSAKATCVFERNDLVQMIFIKVWSKISGFNETCSFKTWLNSIAFNTFYDYCDSQKRRPCSFDALLENGDIAEDNFAELVTPFVELQRADDEKYAWKMIKNLSPILQKVLDLSLQKGLSYKQISRKLKIPVGTTQSRLNSARTKLRDFLMVEFV
jgi:RNA polymerase sigma-70 factor (ECF subfamily)